MGINFNLADGRKFNWDLDILKTARGRATVREVLPQLIEAARADPNHPYNDTRNPGHAAAVAEMQLAYRWLGNEMTNQEESQVAKGLLDAFNTQAPIDDKQAFQELAELMDKPEMRIALQRQRTGQSLDPAQAKLVAQHDELLAANNAQARLERPPTGGRLRGTDNYNAGYILELSKLPPVEQANRARELAAAMRNDPAHPFNDGTHPMHAQAVREMSQLYDAQYFADGGDPVLGEESK